MSRHFLPAIGWICLVALAAGLTSAAFAQEQNPTLVRSSASDWPQWRGPQRDGVSAETGLLRSWPADGPKLLWEASGIGNGYSSPIVVGDTVYITGDKGQDLSISAFTLDGQRRWQTTNGLAWKKSFPGARASCCYDDGRLYHLNAHGRLACLGAEKGNELWSVDVLEKYAAENIMWGISESLLVHGDCVFATPAGAKGLMIALHKQTGEPVWAADALDGERASYSSAILIDAGARKLLINGGAKYVFAVDADTGKLVWKLPQVDPNNTVNATPVLSGQRLFLTNSSRGFGAVFGVRLGDGAAKREWTTELTISHGGAICVNGRACGASSRGDVRGWVTIDTATGKPTQIGELPGGSVVYADQRYYCLTDRGTMQLQSLANSGFETVGSFQLADGRDAWAHPVVAKGRLWLRFHDTIFCYDVSQ